MLKNYFKIAWRNLWKNRTFTVLNLGGLTISLAACLIIFFWASDELNYDTAGSNADRVFRVALTLQAKDQPDKQFALTAAPLAPVLVKDFPEIEKAIRISFNGVLIRNKNDHFYTNKFIYTDPDFFDVFGFSLLRGNPHTALNETNSAVLSESMARKCFGTTDAIGKTLVYNDTVLIKITGIMRDLPATSHFTADIICSFKYLELSSDNNGLNNWWNDNYYTYVLLKNPAVAGSLQNRIANIMHKYNAKQNAELGFEGIHFLQPLKSIHLYSNLRNEINANGSISSLRIFIGIAVFLLVVACINYINLTTATSFKRAKEIGMRKVAGADFVQLITQFLTESVLIAIIGLLLAIGLAAVCLPFFNRMANTGISIASHLSLTLSLLLVGFAVVLGVISGLYPALYLSQIQPVKAFKSRGESNRGMLSLRKVLVVFQFSLSIILIVATIVALQQLHYMQSIDLGMNQEQILTIPFQDYGESLKVPVLKQEFERKGSIESVTSSSTIPGQTLNNIVVLPEGVPSNKTQSMSTLVVDYDFIRTYKLGMRSGRAFSKDFGGDSSAYILNETAVKDLGWTPENAIGKNFDWGLGKKGKVIGVVKDFHFNSLQSKITAVVMHIMPVASGWYGYMSVRMRPGNMKANIRSLQDSWDAILPGHPFQYFFADESYNKQYQGEQRLSNLSMTFSMLTVFISCLGLFGLVMVAIGQRTKEIGIRKVLGASVAGITTLLSKDFLKLVAVSILIASPVAWWMMNRWLADFAYRISIGWWVFALAALLAVLIALITISFQTIRAAMANPVKSLRTE